MFDWVQVRALAGPLKGILRLVPKPLLYCLGCVLRAVVLLEGEPLPQSEVLSALEQVFIKDLSVLCSVHLSFDPSFCRWKTSLQHDAATLVLHRRDGAGFPPDVTLGTQAKRVQSWSQANSKRAVMCLLLATLSYRPDWWSAAEMVVLLEDSPISTEELWSSVRVIGFLVTFLTRRFSPDCSVWLGGQFYEESWWFQTSSI